MTYFDSINERPIIPLGSLIFQCTTGATESSKKVIFPSYLDIESNYTFKINFQNGYNKTSASAMTLNDKLVKVVDGGTLKNLPSHNINGSYKYLDPNTVLELYYNGTDFVVIGNPIVLKSSTYVIYADGKIGDDAVGTIKSYYSSSIPYGWFACDGTNTTGTSKQLSTYYPDLYAILNSNILPDLRECTLVGIGTSSRSILNQTGHSHDTYTLGEFKDDCIQNVKGEVGRFLRKGDETFSHSDGFYNSTSTGTEGKWVLAGGSSGYTTYFSLVNFNASVYMRTSDVTHGKQVGVNYIIKY